jgi:hypothetical protein
MRFNKYITGFLALFLLIGISCTDAVVEEVVDYKNHYKTIPDADNAILGLYGSFMKLAEQVVVLNELRGDLMDVTENSSVDLQEINSNTPSSSNKYCDKTPFYNIILNCNDILDNLDKMKEKNILTVEEYNERYSDVAALRSWTYLQLGIQFGKVNYITDPTVTIEDVNKSSANTEIGLDALLNKLIACMESLPTLENYQNSPLVAYTLDGYQLKNFFINKHLLLGDLYLWNNDYLKAATQYRAVLATGENNPATNNNLIYRASNYVITGETSTRFQIGYIRYKGDDINSYRNFWVNMFKLKAEDSNAANELIWTISYDKSYQPTYPFISLFANTGKGTYQLKPSDYAINNLWEAQVQQNGFKFDGRGRNSSFANVNGQYVVEKYLYDYDASKPYQQSGRWFLYRAGLLLLRYAEAANRCGYPKLAYAIVNQGFNNTYNWSGVRADSTAQTGWGPGNYYPQPFYFDARMSDAPYYRSPWREFGGIRGRVSLANKEFPSTCVTTQDSILFMEKTILEETALECGFEGYRWGDLMRVARRMNKEGRDGAGYLEENLEKKYLLSGQPMPDYSSEEKWYLNIQK